MNLLNHRHLPTVGLSRRLNSGILRFYYLIIGLLVPEISSHSFQTLFWSFGASLFCILVAQPLKAERASCNQWLFIVSINLWCIFVLCEITPILSHANLRKVFPVNASPCVNITVKNYFYKILMINLALKITICTSPCMYVQLLVHISNGKFSINNNPSTNFIYF